MQTKQVSTLVRVSTKEPKKPKTQRIEPAEVPEGDVPPKRKK